MTFEEAQVLAGRAIYDEDGRGLSTTGKRFLTDRVARAIFKAAQTSDTARIDWLEAKINSEGEIHLHDGQHPRGTGLGLRPGCANRTLREAIDVAMLARTQSAPPAAQQIGIGGAE